MTRKRGGLISNLIIALCLIIFLLIWALVEPFFLFVRHSRFYLDQGRPRGSFYPGPAKQTLRCKARREGLRLALFSDLHGMFCRISPGRMLRQIDRADVDAVVFAGDVSTWKKDRKHGLRWLKKLAAGLQERGLSCYTVPGNHDRGLAAAELAETGLIPLYNRARVIRDQSAHSWILVGLEDLLTGRPDLDAALTEVLAPGAGQKDTGPANRTAERTIVIAHNPDTVYRLNAEKAYWLLSGHFHAGQVRLPGRLEFKSLRSEGLPREGIYKHHYSKNGLAGYITNGIGCVLIPLRFLAPPELSILDFESTPS